MRRPTSSIIDRFLRARHTNRFELVRPIGELARVFRAQRFLDPEACRTTTIGEVSDYMQARTFEDFLRVNRLPVYEAVLR